MKFVVFGLTISSSWGNGHATLWRALSSALVGRGHRFVFCERDVPWYAGSRDFFEIPGGKLHLYADVGSLRDLARRELADADVAIVTSYCPDGPLASDLALDSPAAIKCFYDLDTPVTLGHLKQRRDVPYLPPRGLGDFDLVLSYTGGTALDELQQMLGARRVAPLYGWVDPALHRPASPSPQYAGDLSYLGTYAEDRQAALAELLIEPARRLPEKRFVIGGAQYPHAFPWTDNIYFVRHLGPAEHPAFFASSRLTLNVTRRAMAEMGYCPSGRLFEASACGTAIVSDTWEGLEEFFTPGEQVLIARTAADTLDAMGRSDVELHRIAAAARDRTLAEHTADRRARQLEQLLEHSPGPGAAPAELARNSGRGD